MMSVKFLLLIICVLVAYVLGYIFTETKFDLQRWELFDFQMFKCRPCLTFHISWVLTTFTSLLFYDWWMLLWGVCFSLGMFILMKVDEYNRFKD